MDKDSFFIYTIPDYIYKNIAEDVETRLDTSNHELEMKKINWINEG